MTTIFRTIFSRRLAVTFFLGFSSGLPLLVIDTALKAWLTEARIAIEVIGFFSLAGLPYALKFLWAPIMDWYIPPFLGRRRGWMIVTQLLLMAAIFFLGCFNPLHSLTAIAACAMLIAFVSASQDIVLDAHRRDTLADNELGLGSSLFVNGYRIGMLVAGAGSLTLAEWLPWNHVFMVVSAFMVVGLVTTLLAPEPPKPAEALSLREAVLEPFVDYFRRSGAVKILLFILLYRLGDGMASSISTPFMLQLGFSKAEIAAIVKTFGLGATIIGGLAGGIVMLRIGIGHALWSFGILQAVSTLGFSFLAYSGAQPDILAGVIAFENFANGLGIAAFTAYLASLCNKKFSAAQYALLSSLIAVPRILFSAAAGVLAVKLGWVVFYVLCTAAALPGLFLLVLIAPWRNDG